MNNDLIFEIKPKFNNLVRILSENLFTAMSIPIAIDTFLSLYL